MDRISSSVKRMYLLARLANGLLSINLVLLFISFVDVIALKLNVFKMLGISMIGCGKVVLQMLSNNSF